MNAVETPRPPVRLRPTPRQAVLPLLVLAVVFAVALPRIVDYRAVLAALGALDAGQLALLLVVACLAYVASALPYAVLIRGVAWPRVVGADLAGRAVASTIPGPTDVAARLVLYTQWGVPLDRAGAGLVIGGLLETVSALVLPLIALGAIVVSGGTTQAAGALLAAGGVIALALLTAVFAAIVRSEPLALRIGGALERGLDSVFRRLRRRPPDGVTDAVLRLREELHELLDRHGVLAFGAAVLAKLAWFLVLQVALGASGIGPDVLAPATVLATMAIVSFVALVPLTPGALGTSEVAYLGLFATTVDPAYAPQVAAAVLLYRVAQWLIPIPLGWTVFILLRRGRGLFGNAA